MVIRLDGIRYRWYDMSMNIVKQLRKAARDADVTQYRIAKDTGIPVAAIQKWWHGGGLLCSSAEKIAAVLGCRIVLQPMQRSARKAR